MPDFMEYISTETLFSEAERVFEAAATDPCDRTYRAGKSMCGWLSAYYLAKAGAKYV